MRRERSGFWAAALTAAATAFLVTGCMQQAPDANEPGSPPATDNAKVEPPADAKPDAQTPPNAPSAPNKPPEQAADASNAALISDLSYKYGFLALNDVQTYVAALKAENGCKVGREFKAALGDPAKIAATVQAYAEALTASGTQVRDVDTAIANIEQLALDLDALIKLCANGSGDVVAAKSLILTGLAYRADLGLQLPKRLRK